MVWGVFGVVWGYLWKGLGVVSLKYLNCDIIKVFRDGLNVFWGGFKVVWGGLVCFGVVRVESYLWNF